MNSLLIVVIAFVVFFLAYVFYAARLARLWGIDERKDTPAYTKHDGIDYVPAKNPLVLFGHHFASISGAGPIVGPVIAVALWGWLPVVIWIIVGSILIGGVHDFGSLITSVREGGSSVADIADRAVSHRAKIFFSLFIWLTLILVIAVFAFFCADTFVKEPRIVVPSLGLIPVAVLVGYLLYNMRLNPALVTLVGLGLLGGFIFIGNFWTVTFDLKVWIIVLLLYSYIASILPVNILLQPRDYLASYLLIFGVGAGLLGIFLTHPKIEMPAYLSWSNNEGMLWPALFVTVACGAVSGFHSLIASGTSSKQLANERHAKSIGYGAMIFEGLVAIVAVICAALLLSSKGQFAGVLKSEGPIKIFGDGYGMLTAGFFSGYGSFLALAILNVFILTSLDTATRISRYLTEELFRVKNRYVSTLFVVVIAGALALSGKWHKLWPAFGASNQLVAALALFVISCWLISKKKKSTVTLWPAFFMLATTVGSLIFQGVRYVTQHDYMLLTITALLLVLSGFMVCEVAPLVFNKGKLRHG